MIRLYFERRRLKADLSAADANDMSHSGLRLELRIEEIEAELDALTGGAFSRLARREAAAEDPPPHDDDLLPSPTAPAIQRRHPGRRCRSRATSSPRARATCRAPGCAWWPCSRSLRDTEISLELVLTFGDAGTSEPLKRASAGSPGARRCSARTRSA